jgi:3-phenylpropionate/trans-cinnamate dioxygenase ferredoxin subunit
MSAIDVGALDDFTDGAASSRLVAGRELVIIRIGADLYVLDDRCSHEDFPLSLGEVNIETVEIECERHGAMFNLTDGTPSSFPATRPVPTYAVSVRDGRCFVEVPA